MTLHFFPAQRLSPFFVFAWMLTITHACVMAEDQPSSDRDAQDPFQYRWLHSQSPVNASLRGAATSKTGDAWVSGSSGTVLRTTNGGQTWEAMTVPNFDQNDSTIVDIETPETASDGATSVDFRDVEVLPDGSVLLMSVGAGPASRLIRLDAGANQWRVVLQNEHANGFFDGMDFDTAGQLGALYGDAVEGRFDLYLTENGGKSWTRIQAENRPLAKPGEHAFAASGTGIQVDGSTIRFATGGSVARVATSTDRGNHWTFKETPLQSGKPSTGIFSLATIDLDRFVIVGGDYQTPELDRDTAATTVDGGEKWKSSPSPLQHRACVRHLGGEHLLSCGRTGVAVSTDGGMHWKTISNEGYYTAAVDLPRQRAYLAGSDGRIVVLRWSPQGPAASTHR